MSSQVEQQQRPSSGPPDNRKKEALNEIIAQDGDGNQYRIPVSAAQQFKVSELHEKEKDEAEVGGRDLRYSPSYGWHYHGWWAYGPYVWWRDGRSYTGWHWHPYRNNFYAYDEDDY